MTVPHCRVEPLPLWQVWAIDATLQGQMEKKRGPQTNWFRKCQRYDSACTSSGTLRGRRYSLFLTNFGADASFWTRPFVLSPLLMQAHGETPDWCFGEGSMGPGDDGRGTSGVVDMPRDSASHLTTAK